MMSAIAADYGIGTPPAILRAAKGVPMTIAEIMNKSRLILLKSTDGKGEKCEIVSEDEHGLLVRLERGVERLYFWGQIVSVENVSEH
jgi:hypothetical protein